MLECVFQLFVGTRKIIGHHQLIICIGVNQKHGKHNNKKSSYLDIDEIENFDKWRKLKSIRKLATHLTDTK